jgi:hypothetical protein
MKPDRRARKGIRIHKDTEQSFFFQSVINTWKRWRTVKKIFTKVNRCYRGRTGYRLYLLASGTIKLCKISPTAEKDDLFTL